MVCYRSLLATPDQARTACHEGDIVVVGSSRVVRLLVESIPPASRPWLVAIGRTSAEEAMRAGWRSLAAASEPSAPRVLDLIRLLLAALA
jgi:uroporphyrinogen-III synthase